MAQTVADILVDALSQIGVRQIFGLIGNSLNPLANPSAEATLNGSASATRKARRLPPPARRS